LSKSAGRNSRAGDAVAGLYFEDFAEGQVFEHATTRTVTEMDNVLFTTLGTTIANLGMSDVRFPKPVFHGDTVRARTTVVGKRMSKSRQDAGIVEFEHQGLNQRGETVAICRRAAFMKCRPA
jgi:acyl dehydratase